MWRWRQLKATVGRVELVRRIFEMYVREGLGLKAITERLNSECIPSPRDGHRSENTGRSWGISTPQSILKNPVYTGDMVWYGSGGPLLSPKEDIPTSKD